MKNKNIRKNSPVPLKECGVFSAADLVGDKWTLLILREAFYGIVRFDDIRVDLNIPRSVLTNRLKKLVANNIMYREPYREDNSRTRYLYMLTPQGASLAPVIIALMQWGDHYIKKGSSPLTLLHKESGEQLKVAIVREKAEDVSLTDISININE